MPAVYLNKVESLPENLGQDHCKCSKLFGGMQKNNVWEKFKQNHYSSSNCNGKKNTLLCSPSLHRTSFFLKRGETEQEYLGVKRKRWKESCLCECPQRTGRTEGTLVLEQRRGSWGLSMSTWADSEMDVIKQLSCGENNDHMSVSRASSARIRLVLQITH